MTQPQAQFTFDQRFQLALLKLVVEDDAFAALAVRHLQSTYFENPSHRWIFQCVQAHWERYGHAPTISSVYEYVRMLDPLVAAQYQPTVVALETHGRVDAQFIGDRFVDFIKRNLFVDAFEKTKALYNAGQTDKAYDLWMRKGEEVHGVRVGEIDRGYFFEQFEERQKHRMAQSVQAHLHTFSTGIPDIDAVLNGGLSIGEMGLWIAREKAGKSQLLCWLAFYAVRALRIPVLDIVLEGGRALHEDRFDAAFSSTAVNLIKRGEMDAHSHRTLVEEFRELRSLLIVRSFTKGDDAWETTVADVYAELKDLRRQGIRPKMLVVDYADLLRTPGAEGETQHQTGAYKGLRQLCDRDDGLACWTAAQIQRVPAAAMVDSNYLIRGQHVSDAIGKVRIPEFYGSINRTDDEEQNQRVRLYAEQYRHGAAGKVVHLETDYARGRFVRSVLSSYDAPSAPLPDEDAPQGRFF